MPERLIPVNLGFAEFVSLLVRETFDSIVNSQLEQIIKIEEFNAVLTSNGDSFALQFIKDDDIKSEIEQVFSTDILSNTIEYSAEEIKEITDLTSEITTADFKNGKMLDSGKSKVVKYATSRIIERKKAVIQAALMSSLIPKLQIDSGEITAKLTFSVSQIEAARPDSAPNKRRVVRRGLSINTSNLSSISALKNLGKEFIDPRSKEKFILIDKNQLMANNEAIKNPLPNIRLTVRQAETATSNANVYSEVTIKFKSL